MLRLAGNPNLRIPSDIQSKLLKAFLVAEYTHKHLLHFPVLKQLTQMSQSSVIYCTTTCNYLNNKHSASLFVNKQNIWQFLFLFDTSAKVIKQILFDILPLILSITNIQNFTAIRKSRNKPINNIRD